MPNTLDFKMDSSLRTLVRTALKEDLGKAGDISSRYFLPANIRFKGAIVAKQKGVLCGLGVAREVCRQVSRKIRFRPLMKDGDCLQPGDVVAEVSGPREILSAERVALNFLQRLSGVATATRELANLIQGTRARLLDTRKTLPGWRALDKYAVRCGGGLNHRMGLYDMVMIKDNHLAAMGLSSATDSGIARLCRLVERFRKRHPKIKVLFEAKLSSEIDWALSCRADIILLDNMPLPALKSSIRHIRAVAPKTLIEASGGVNRRTIGAIAKLGPDRISVGAITHSAPALDISLELENA